MTFIQSTVLLAHSGDQPSLFATFSKGIYFGLLRSYFSHYLHSLAFIYFLGVRDSS